MDYLIYYISTGLITLLVICIIRGYNGTKYHKSDIFDSIFWPLSFCVIIGVMIKVIYLFTSEKLKNKGKKWQSK